MAEVSEQQNKLANNVKFMEWMKNQNYNGDLSLYTISKCEDVSDAQWCELLDTSGLFTSIVKDHQVVGVTSNKVTMFHVCLTEKIGTKKIQIISIQASMYKAVKAIVEHKDRKWGKTFSRIHHFVSTLSQPEIPLFEIIDTAYVFPDSLEYGITIFEKYFHKTVSGNVLLQIPTIEFGSFMIGLCTYIPNFREKLATYLMQNAEPNSQSVYADLITARTLNLPIVLDPGTRAIYTHTMTLLNQDVALVKTILILSLICSNKQFAEDNHRTAFLTRRKQALKTITFVGEKNIPEFTKEYIIELNEFFARCPVFKSLLYTHLLYDETLSEGSWNSCITHLKTLCAFSGLHTYVFIHRFLETPIKTAAHFHEGVTREIATFVEEEQKMQSLLGEKESLSFFKLTHPGADVMIMSKMEHLSYASIAHIQLTEKRMLQYKQKNISAAETLNMQVQKTTTTTTVRVVSHHTELTLGAMGLSEEDVKRMTEDLNSNTSVDNPTDDNDILTEFAALLRARKAKK